MAKYSQLKTGVILSYLNLALSTLIPFFYTPVMLRMLGISEYGLFSLSNSVISYLSLLSFGFGGTIVRYITFYRAKDEQEKVQRTFGLFLMLFSAIALLVMACGVIISWQADNIFHQGLTDAEIDKMRLLMLIMTFNTAVSFPISVFSSVIMSYERFIFKKLIDMILTVAAPLSNLVMLYLGFASVGMALANTAIQFLTLPLLVFYCYRVISVKPKIGKLEKGVIKEMVLFSGYTFLGSVVDMLFWATDKVILGMLTSTVMVAVYNIGSTFNGMVTNLSAAVSNLLAPKTTTMVAKEAKKKELSDLFIKVGRLQYFIVLLAVSGFAIFGREFIYLWAGAEYSDAYFIALLTLIPLCVPLIQNTGLSIVMAQNKHKFRSVTYLIIAIANVVSTYILVPYMGAIGAALCSAISYIVGQGIVMNIYYYKVTEIDIPGFWKSIAKMSIAPLFVIGIACVAKIWIGFDNWLLFFGGVIIYSIVFALAMFYFSFNSYEKDLLIKPLQKLIAKIPLRKTKG